MAYACIVLHALSPEANAICDNGALKLKNKNQWSLAFLLSSNHSIRSFGTIWSAQAYKFFSLYLISLIVSTISSPIFFNPVQQNHSVYHFLPGENILRKTRTCQAEDVFKITRKYMASKVAFGSRKISYLDNTYHSLGLPIFRIMWATLYSYSRVRKGRPKRLGLLFAIITPITWTSKG